MVILFSPDSGKEIGGAAILFGGLFLSWTYTLCQLKRKNSDGFNTLFIDPTPQEQKEEERLLGISQ